VRPPLYQLERVALFHRDHEDGGGTWQEGDPEAIDAAVGSAGDALDRWERFVADGGTVTGAFTIADCAAGPVLWRSLRLPLDFSRWPKTAAVRDAVAARPSFLAAGPVG